MTPIVLPTLTLPGRELVLLGLAADGLTDAQIATAVVLKRRTVSRYMSQVLGRMGAETRTQAVAMAYQAGWLHRSPCPRRGPRLTDRQLEVLRLYVAGRVEREICAELSLQPRGLAKHRNTLRERLQARNRTHLVRLAIDTGVVEIPGRPSC